MWIQMSSRRTHNPMWADVDPDVITSGNVVVDVASDVVPGVVVVDVDLTM